MSTKNSDIASQISESRNEKKRPPKCNPSNPIETAIKTWLNILPTDLLESITSDINILISIAPKRWTVYPPMILLPSGSFSSHWEQILSSTPPEQVQDLWRLILQEVGKREGKGVLTHLAVNSGIPLNKTTQEDKEENILRTPSGLIMLHGDFGPALSPDQTPSYEDFENAFWVSTKQNGITQIWAPRYTMFSRGNIKEKARLLDFHKRVKIETRNVSLDEIKQAVAVDLYAGIGYFVFSYVAMGIGRVVGWELNPWSVEGLRRGAIANAWAVKVIKAGDEVEVGDERIVIFQEDNNMVEQRIRVESMRTILLGKTLHVNCGLLPTSLPVWRNALLLLTKAPGWLHLHENVGNDDISQRSREIEALLSDWGASIDTRKHVTVEHVELVKTFAPGVWHCVFDVFVSDAV